MVLHYGMLRQETQKGKSRLLYGFYLRIWVRRVLPCARFLMSGVNVFVIGRGWKVRVVFEPLMGLPYGMLRQETQPGKSRRCPAFALRL
jgi:hypothetical protein